MKMRARRKFVFSSCDHRLEARLSPASLAFSAPPVPALVGALSAPRGGDPLPHPQPDHGTYGTYPGKNPPPTSGPVGPGTS